MLYSSVLCLFAILCLCVCVSVFVSIALACGSLWLAVWCCELFCDCCLCLFVRSGFNVFVCFDYAVLCGVLHGVFVCIFLCVCAGVSIKVCLCFVCGLLCDVAWFGYV